uniref:Uncharacterized protein n=1 Tax=Chrysotila carterae TaxID=13221 RepID=A0A7S4C5V8_CHRCT
MGGDLTDELPVLVSLYEELWRTHAEISIPDSLVWKYGRLDHWYFTSTEQGSPRLKRKLSSTVNKGDGMFSNVVHAFTKHLRLDRIEDEAERDSVAGQVVACWIGGNPEKPCEVRHLTADTLSDFLTNYGQKHGVLQRWLLPSTQKHVQATRIEWSPHVVNMETRTNLNAIDDDNIPLAQRMATFEGPCRSTRLLAVNNHLRREARAKAQLMASALDLIVAPEHHVSKLILTFVQDAAGKLLFSWCGCLRLLHKDGGAPKGSCLTTELHKMHTLSVPAALSAEALAAEKAARLAASRLDGSCFHIPTPMMGSFVRPDWWTQEDPAPPLDTGIVIPSEIPGEAWEIQKLRQVIFNHGPPQGAPPNTLPMGEKLSAEVDSIVAAVEGGYVPLSAQMLLLRTAAAIEARETPLDAREPIPPAEPSPMRKTQRRPLESARTLSRTRVSTGAAADPSTRTNAHAATHSTSHSPARSPAHSSSRAPARSSSAASSSSLAGTQQHGAANRGSRDTQKRLVSSAKSGGHASARASSEKLRLSTSSGSNAARSSPAPSHAPSHASWNFSASSLPTDFDSQPARSPPYIRVQITSRQQSKADLHADGEPGQQPLSTSAVAISMSVVPPRLPHGLRRRPPPQATHLPHLLSSAEWNADRTARAATALKRLALMNSPRRGGAGAIISLPPLPPGSVSFDSTPRQMPMSKSMLRAVRGYKEGLVAPEIMFQPTFFTREAEAKKYQQGRSGAATAR